MKAERGDYNASRYRLPTQSASQRAYSWSAITDGWGINHVYAENEEDLCFAQGYAVARDRLFQFEVWRRQATGTVAEILGPCEVVISRPQGLVWNVTSEIDNARAVARSRPG